MAFLKWYIEKETKELRQALENEILKLPQVDYKKIFGCPCYLANGKMFTGLVTKGLIITKLNETEKETLQKIKPIKPFIAGDKIIKSWVTLIWIRTNSKRSCPMSKKAMNEQKYLGRAHILLV